MLCMIFRTLVTDTPRSTSLSAMMPPTLPSTAIASHGSTERNPDD